MLSTTTALDPRLDARKLWILELGEFLKYVVGVASPATVIDHDQEILSCLAECLERELVAEEKIARFMVQLGDHPWQPPHRLELGALNFIRADLLIPVFHETIGRDLTVLEGLKAAYAGRKKLVERQVAYLIDELIKLRKDFEKQADKLARGHKAALAAAGAPKGAQVGEPLAQEGPKQAADGEEEEFPWHDEDLSIEERMGLARQGGLFEKLFAAMAQTDCTACGYDCEGYARAIAEGKENDLSRCAPGEIETQEMLETIIKKGS